MQSSFAWLLFFYYLCTVFQSIANPSEYNYRWKARLALSSEPTIGKEIYYWQTNYCQTNELNAYIRAGKDGYLWFT